MLLPREIERLDDKVPTNEKPLLEERREKFLQAMVDLGNDEDLAKKAWNEFVDKENKSDAEIEQEGNLSINIASQR